MRRAPLLSLCVLVTACGGARAAPAAAPFREEPRVEEPKRDDDGDGVIAPDDRCPDAPEDRDERDDDDGCPDDDNDGDHVTDRDDRCPDDAEDRDGFEDDDGCPDPDNDRDLIADRDDRCPNEPEVFNGCYDDDGCPDSGFLRVHPPREDGPPQIRHLDGGITDDAESREMVDRLVDFLRLRPDVELVALEGHVAARRRPQAIRRSADIATDLGHLLVRRGVDRSRLVTYGVGDLCPADPRNTPDALARNDRVVLWLVRVGGQRTSLRVGCARASRLIPPIIGPPSVPVASPPICAR